MDVNKLFLLNRQLLNLRLFTVHGQSKTIGNVCSQYAGFKTDIHPMQNHNVLKRFRVLRKKKELSSEFVKDFPNFTELRSMKKKTPPEQREELKKQGKMPPRTDRVRPINISCTGDVLDPYVPPEGDGKMSLVSGEGAKQRLSEFGKKGKSFMSTRQVKKYDEDFDVKDFAEMGQNMYIEAQNLLQNYKENEDSLHEIVSEKAYPEMTYGLSNKTFRWKFLESVEPPRVVYVRAQDMLSKDNVYAQVTVRMHLKQTLAVYDRFGRRMYGSEVVARDILEYVIFEKHLSNIYGVWRVHGKIVPDWMPLGESIIRTYRQQHFEPIVKDETESDIKTKTDDSSTSGGSNEKTLATA